MTSDFDLPDTQKEYIKRFGARWIDEFTKDKNAHEGKTPCKHCSGTGNEFYSMYRMCPECQGTGVQK
jgi:hypothetical protein